MVCGFSVCVPFQCSYLVNGEMKTQAPTGATGAPLVKIILKDKEDCFLKFYLHGSNYLRFHSGWGKVITFEKGWGSWCSC